jgi:hypothetical protein
LYGEESRAKWKWFPDREFVVLKTAHGSKNKDEMGAHHMKAKDQTLTLKLSLTQGDEMARAVNT